MNKLFYSFAIFCCALQVGIALFMGALFYRAGFPLYQRAAFLPCFYWSSAFFFVMQIIVLTYYFHKKYWLTFSTVLVFLLSAAGYHFTVYRALTTGRGHPWFETSQLFFVATALLAYASLLFFAPGKRFWLKVLGIAGVCLQICLIALNALLKREQGFHVMTMLNTAQTIVGFILSILPLLFVFNFWRELRAVAPEKARQAKRPLKIAAGSVAIGMLVITILLTMNLANNNEMAPLFQNKTTSDAEQIARDFTPAVWVNNAGDTLRYRWLQPANYDPAKQYPLVVCLHGGGGQGTDNVCQFAYADFPTLFADSANRARYPAFIFVPQCPPGTGWGGVPNMPAVDALVYEAIAALHQKFPIDTDRQYVLGMSLGGYGAWHFICKRPKLFAAAVPVCGGGDPTFAEEIKSVAVWAFHGANDPAVPVRYSRDMVEAIRKAGGHPRYTEYEAQGHSILLSVTNTADLLPWLFAQRRSIAEKSALPKK